MSNRPGVWVGHVDLKTKDLAGSHKFLADLGLRFVFGNDSMVIYELRGGTHLIMAVGDDIPELAEFDFMVEDIDLSHGEIANHGYEVGDIERGSIHDTFIVSEPGGNRIRVNSSHVEDHSIV